MRPDCWPLATLSDLGETEAGKRGQNPVKEAKKLVRNLVDKGKNNPGMHPLPWNGQCSRQKEWGLA